MPEPLDQLKIVLKQNGQSLTAARVAVFSALQGEEPQSMHEVVLACAGSVNRASVYRIISLFERLGIVQKLQIGWKYKLELSGDFHHHHHHLTCSRCGVTTPLPENPDLEKQLEAMAGQQNFIMKGHQLEIQGLCNSCQATSRIT